MSYILDALRKSEAERASANAPTVTTVHEAPQTSARQRWLWWLLPLNLAVVVIALWSWSPRQAAQDSADLPTPAELPEVARPLAPEPIPTVTESTARRIVAEQDLTEPLRSRVARLRFSTHIYADDEAMRSVSIDGERLRQGQSSAQGFRVVEITPDGVILDIDGTRVAVDVMARWRF